MKKKQEQGQKEHFSQKDQTKTKPASELVYKIWKNHFDIAEVNHHNYHQLKNQFKLTTWKISFLAMLLVVEIIFSVISFFALGLFPVGGFLTFNIIFWIYLISYMGVGFFYTGLLLEIGTWFRMALGTDVTSCLAINLSDLTMLIAFSGLLFLINYVRIRITAIKTSQSRILGYLFSIIISYLLASLIAAGFDVVYNKYFLIDVFYSNNGGKPNQIKPLLIIIFWFNLVQYLINLLIFLPTFKVNYVLLNRYYQKPKQKK